MANKFFGFFSESRQELAKVNWPSRQELFQSTVLVIVVTLLMAVFVWVFDAIFSVLMRFITG